MAIGWKWAFLKIWMVPVVFAEFLLTRHAPSTVRFQVPPLKVSDISANNIQDYYTCVRWNIETPSYVLFLEIGRTDYPVHDVDANRFGPTSLQLGRQKLRMDILDSGNNLILRNKNVSSSGCTLSFSGDNLSVVDVCLSNISYDSSWKAIDMTAVVDLTIYSANQASSSVISHLTDTEVDLFNGAVHDAHKFDSDVNDFFVSEAEKRDFNESTYTWLFCRLLFLAVTLFIWYCMVVPLFLLRFVKEQQLSTMRKLPE